LDSLVGLFKLFLIVAQGHDISMGAVLKSGHSVCQVGLFHSIIVEFLDLFCVEGGECCPFSASNKNVGVQFFLPGIIDCSHFFHGNTTVSEGILAVDNEGVIGHFSLFEYCNVLVVLFHRSKVLGWACWVGLVLSVCDSVVDSTVGFPFFHFGVD